MKKTKDTWEDELYVDPRPLTDDDKKAIRDFIENYSLKKRKPTTGNQPTKGLRKRTIA